MSKYKVGGYVRLSQDDDYSESYSIQRQMDLIKIKASKSIKNDSKYPKNGIAFRVWCFESNFLKNIIY